MGVHSFVLSRRNGRFVSRIARYPALSLISAFAPAVQLVVSLLPIPLPVDTGINAVAVAAAGIVTAFYLHQDQDVPALLGGAQAVLVLALGFGAHLTASQQALWMTVAGIVVGAFVHTQVTPPPPATPDTPAVVNGPQYD